MTWVKTDDSAPEHMKQRESGTAAYALWNAALAFCNRNLTDGRIDKRLLADIWRPVGEKFHHKVAALRLVSSGLWHDNGFVCQSTLCPAYPELNAKLDPFANAYVVHDYFDYQRSKIEVLAERASTADRVRRHRDRKLTKGAPVETNAVGNATRNAVTNTVSNTPPDPIPDPDPILMRDLGPPLKLNEVEKLCFSRTGQLGGVDQTIIGALMPIYREELDAALRTPGNSWKYIAKVIRSIRTERSSEPPPKYKPPREKNNPTDDYVPPYLRPENNWKNQKPPEPLPQNVVIPEPKWNTKPESGGAT